ncbi:MAG TPA: DUF2007 domain-containing protein [Candidatus Mediterraneibacter excrementigallinarum]|nr:DUF2007 domain-containing protein [Candidatus Mediterraneibacter excrementigallinarum]
MKGMKPVKVYSCADRVQADMLTEALRREGIPAYAESKGSGDYLNIYMGTSVFGETIYVDENDAARAKEIIKDMTGADMDATVSPTEQEQTSQFSGKAAEKITRKLLAVRIVSLIAALFLLIGAVVPSLINIFWG